MMRRPFVHLERRDYQQEVAVWIGEERNEGAYFQPHLLLEPTAQPFRLPPEPTLRLTDDQGQQLVNQLWRAGFRPSEAVSSTGEREAMREHIKDLRGVIDRLFLISVPPVVRHQGNVKL